MVTNFEKLFEMFKKWSKMVENGLKALENLQMSFER